MSVTDEVADEIERTIELRRDGEHSYIGTSRGDFLKNVVPCELPVGASARQTETLERLSAPVIRTDEIALEMRRQRSRRRRHRARTAFPNSSKQAPEDRWRARD